MDKIIPLGNRIIVKQLKEEEGAMVISKAVGREDKAVGEVMAIGEDVSLTLTIGDKIIYDEFSGMFVPGSEDTLILDAGKILAKYVQ